jgi:hypothetical protein
MAVVLTLFAKVNVKVWLAPAAIVRLLALPLNEVVTSEPPPVEVLKIVFAPIVTDSRLPLVICGQLICSAVSTWATAVLFWNVITTVWPEKVLPVTTIPGVGVGDAVGVAVGVGEAVGVGVGVNAGMVTYVHP